MQPRTQPPCARGDEDDLYRSHHRILYRTVARHINGPRELIEDACQFAWLKLLDSQPSRESIFGWLYVVALHEAYRLSTIERRDARLGRLRPEDGSWDDVMADPRTVEGAHDALEALRALAALPERQRIDFALKVAGYSYEEIQARTPWPHLHQCQQVAHQGSRAPAQRAGVIGPGPRSPVGPLLLDMTRQPDPTPPPVLIDLQILTAGERRDLANALLRAAWSAALEHTRILLLDLFLEVDEASLGGQA